MSHVQGEGHKYKEPTFYDNWGSEYEVWPLVFCIGFAVFMGSAVGLGIMMTSPDARLSKHRRKAIFRGDLQDYLETGDTDAIKEYLRIDDTDWPLND